MPQGSVRALLEPCDLGSACFFLVPNATLRDLFPIYTTKDRGCVLASSSPPSLSTTKPGMAPGLCSSSGFFFISISGISGPGCPRTQLIFITLVCGRCYVTGGETEAQAGSVICPRQHRAPRGLGPGGPWHRPVRLATGGAAWAWGHQP